ncbi:hypothetical protein K469DRAFT_774337 [Zopfia rhizophila CBS 207.26]|uniref:Uncharacterized protein n=1 Tax=Zopfia rhizophila CBS 207.26 TaxID=1314779 RepID=A0A6A6EV45_9PEZI|nr:hypothetical protein K469DRAFT_774337 [Zopfia rhizophila CBS 207.26]
MTALSDAEIRTIEDLVRPCTGTQYHDLECGHRIRTSKVEICGPNCSNPYRDPILPHTLTFICTTCTFADQIEYFTHWSEIMPVALSSTEIENMAKKETGEVMRNRVAAGKVRDCDAVEEMELINQCSLDWPVLDESLFSAGASENVPDNEDRPYGKTDSGVLKGSRLAAVESRRKREDGRWRPYNFKTYPDTNRECSRSAKREVEDLFRYRQRDDPPRKDGDAVSESSGRNALDSLIDQLSDSRVGHQKEDSATAECREAIEDMAIEEDL